MQTRTTGPTLRRNAALAVAVWCWLPACRDRETQPAAAANGRQAAVAPAVPDGLAAATADASLAPWRRELLELAFTAASGFPLMPHHKDRARAQEPVVLAAIGLDQPLLAERQIRQMQNWRQGVCQANLALWCARHGDSTGARHFAALASARADAVLQEADAQEWRRDRIRAIVAEVHLALGDTEAALRHAHELVHSEAGRFEVARAGQMEFPDFGQFVGAVEQVFVTGDLDEVKNALEVCARLHDRFFTDATRRGALRDAIRSGGRKLPPELYIDVLAKLVDHAVAHQDRNSATEVCDEVRSLIVGARWLPEHEVPVRARLALLTLRAGDTEAARAEIDKALALYDRERDKIVDIWRAGALRPLAEAMVACGDRARALEAYRRVVEEGMHNPNSRPRANDLVATCVSLARQDLEPDTALMNRLRQITKGLGDPW